MILTIKPIPYTVPSWSYPRILVSILQIPLSPFFFFCTLISLRAFKTASSIRKWKPSPYMAPVTTYLWVTGISNLRGVSVSCASLLSYILHFHCTLYSRNSRLIPSSYHSLRGTGSSEGIRSYRLSCAGLLLCGPLSVRHEAYVAVGTALAPKAGKLCSVF
jgi:hypothetical protein